MSPRPTGLAAWLCAAVLGLNMAGPAAAQSTPSGAQKPAYRDPLGAPPKLPWEDAVKKLYEKPVFGRSGRDPFGGDPARDLYRDPARALGLPENPRFDADPEAPAPEGPSPEQRARFGGFDADGDGFITSREYLGQRMTRAPLGAGSQARRQQIQSRLGGRFRSADRNGDGRVSLDEFSTARDPRF